MAQSMTCMTKQDLLRVLENYDNNEAVGVLFEAQNGNNPKHQVFMFFNKIDTFQ